MILSRQKMLGFCFLFCVLSLGEAVPVPYMTKTSSSQYMTDIGHPANKNLGSQIATATRYERPPPGIHQWFILQKLVGFGIIFDYATFNVDRTPEKMSLLTSKLPISHLYSGTVKHLSTKSNQI